jgi:hypothetical protein
VAGRPRRPKGLQSTGSQTSLPRPMGRLHGTGKCARGASAIGLGGDSKAQSPKSEVRSPKSKVRRPKSKAQSPKSKVRRPTAGAGEIRKPKTENRRKAEIRNPNNAFRAAAARSSFGFRIWSRAGGSKGRGRRRRDCAGCDARGPCCQRRPGHAVLCRDSRGNGCATSRPSCEARQWLWLG